MVMTPYVWAEDSVGVNDSLCMGRGYRGVVMTPYVWAEGIVMW